MADAAGNYELLALPFDGSLPRFTASAKTQRTPVPGLVIYHSPQCPYIADCIGQVSRYCDENGIEFQPIPVRSANDAKAVPGVFNNWAVFLDGQFKTVHLLNENLLKKLLTQAE